MLRTPVTALVVTLATCTLTVSAVLGGGSARAAQAAVDTPGRTTASGPALPSPKAADHAADLNAALAGVAAAGMPGVLARVEDPTTGVHWTGAGGVADIHTGTPMRPDLRFRIGSITKTFVATVVLQYVAEGHVHLDDPVAAYLPPGVLPGDLGRRITVRMLLNHASGLPDYDTVLYRANSDIEKYRLADFEPGDLVRLALTQPVGEPGGAWSYANTNYVLAGMIVERISGRSVQDEVQRRIIRPLRLGHTSFPVKSPFVRGAHARSYVPVGTPQNPLVDFSVYTPTIVGAAGAIISTTADLDRFFAALLSGRLLPPAQLAQMRTTVPTPAGYDYGLGLRTFQLCGTWWGHDGLVWGTQALQLTSPDGRRRITLGTDMSHYGAPGNPIDQAIVRFLVAAGCPGQASAAARAQARQTAQRLVRQLWSEPAVDLPGR